MRFERHESEEEDYQEDDSEEDYEQHELALDAVAKPEERRNGDLRSKDGKMSG